MYGLDLKKSKNWIVIQMVEMVRILMGKKLDIMTHKDRAPAYCRLRACLGLI